MNDLIIPFLVAQAEEPIKDISLRMDIIERHSLMHLLWEQPQISPKTNFALAYNDDCFFLKFYVEEPYIKAQHRTTNSPVYLDSCVEFFVGFGNDAAYYNLEFNCAGTCLGQFGPAKTSRSFLPVDVIEKIEIHSHLKNSKNGGLHYWELTVRIPNNVFIHHDLNQFTPGHLRLNFYKCGDELPEPHYLAWNEPVSAEPNFHLPEYFGIGHLAGAAISKMNRQ